MHGRINECVILNNYVLHHTTSLFVTVISTVIIAITSVAVLNTAPIITTELRGVAAWVIGAWGKLVPKSKVSGLHE